MTINERYGFAAFPEAVSAPLDDFPNALRRQLETTLIGLTHLWRAAEWSAFRDSRGTVYLRVTLDVGERPFHLCVFRDGSSLQFSAPVFSGFPKEASHFVLSELCGQNTYLSFRVDRHARIGRVGESRQARSLDRDGSQVGKRDSSQAVLMAWGRFEFDSFLEQSSSLLPYLVNRTTQAERDVRAFLEASYFPAPSTPHLA